MKYTTQGNCPFCDVELVGYSGGWAMSQEGFEEMKRKHESGHPENGSKPTTQEANDMALEIYDWIKENYISKQSLITQIKELDQEPTRQGIINLIEKL